MIFFGALSLTRKNYPIADICKNNLIIYIAHVHIIVSFTEIWRLITKEYIQRNILFINWVNIVRWAIHQVGSTALHISPNSAAHYYLLLKGVSVLENRARSWKSLWNAIMRDNEESFWFTTFLFPLGTNTNGTTRILDTNASWLCTKFYMCVRERLDEGLLFTVGGGVYTKCTSASRFKSETLAKQ